MLGGDLMSKRGLILTQCRRPVVRSFLTAHLELLLQAFSDNNSHLTLLGHTGVGLPAGGGGSEGENSLSLNQYFSVERILLIS